MKNEALNLSAVRQNIITNSACAFAYKFSPARCLNMNFAQEGVGKFCRLEKGIHSSVGH